jgi:hypothetical protein
LGAVPPVKMSMSPALKVAAPQSKSSLAAAKVTDFSVEAAVNPVDATEKVPVPALVNV